MFIYTNEEITQRLLMNGFKPMKTESTFSIFPFNKKMLELFSTNDKGKYMKTDKLVFGININFKKEVE